MSQTFLDLTYRLQKKYYQHLYLIYYKKIYYYWSNNIYYAL